MVKSGGRDPQLHKKLLYLRANNGGPGTDVDVEELVMDDGVQCVALKSEAFDAVFGGKKNMYTEIARETAEYIEVIGLSNLIITTSALYKSGISDVRLV